MRTLVGALVASVIAWSPEADAKCAMQHLVAQVQPEVSNGAIVMLISGSYNDPRTDDTSTWTFRVNDKDVAPVIEKLAPGLSVYRLPKGVTAAELTDGKTTLAKVTATTAKPLPAPKVKRVEHSAPEPDERRGSSRTTVELVGNAPADAIAIVITDANGKALSFGRLAYGSGIQPYYHGRCGVLPNDTVEPAVGQTVRVFWVDKYGQASAKSAAIKIAKKRE
jgi:hypothetical protein